MVEEEERLGNEIIMENDRIRVWDHRVASGSPGHTHTHRRPYVSVVVRGETGETVGPEGEVLTNFELRPGSVLWYGPADLPERHALRNTGDADVAIVTIELL